MSEFYTPDNVPDEYDPVFTESELEKLKASIQWEYGLWNSYVGDLNTSQPGPTNLPSFTTFRGSILAPAFADYRTEDVTISFYIKHDFLLYTKVYPYIHWSPGNNTNTGVVRWGLEYILAKGHGQEAFTSPTTVYVEQAGSGTAYQHQLVQVAEGDGILTESLEPNSVLMFRVFRDGAHANDTFTGNAFGLYLGLHYQRIREGTLNKEPDFYRKEES